MTDVFSKEKRSWVMSRIRSKDTTPEIILRKLVWNAGIRYRLYSSNVKGRPDMVIRKYKIAIFVDGDFWHGYNWNNLKKKLRGNYWPAKIENNIKRDRRINRQLKKEGWSVIRLWEHQVKKEPERCLDAVLLKIEQHQNSISRRVPRYD